SLKTSIKTITYLSDIGCLEIQGASLAGRCDLVETDNSCVENCLKGKFKEVRPRYSVLPDIFTPINLGLFKNCQDWSNDSLETCKMKCSGNNIGRFIRFVFTGVM
ncbi:hypothetical protein ACNITS_24775, partial [Escherichia coli]